MISEINFCGRKLTKFENPCFKLRCDSHFQRALAQTKVINLKTQQHAETHAENNCRNAALMHSTTDIAIIWLFEIGLRGNDCGNVMVSIFGTLPQLNLEYFIIYFCIFSLENLTFIRPFHFYLFLLYVI